MKPILGWLVTGLIFSAVIAHAQQPPSPTKSTPSAASPSLSRDIRSKSNEIEKTITATQKEKLQSICRELKKSPHLKVQNAGQVEAVRERLAKTFSTADARQVDFFAVYVLNQMYTQGEWSLPSDLQKQQQLIQMLSNVSSLLNDPGAANIRKLG